MVVMIRRQKAKSDFRIFWPSAIPALAMQISMGPRSLAALAIPEVLGYTEISGTPVITGLYTILIPMALFAVFGRAHHS